MSRNRRTSFDEARRRGLSRVAPITAGIVLAGGVVSVSTAVALAATRDAPGATTTTPGGAGATTAPARGSVTVPQRRTDQRPAQRRAEPSATNRLPTVAPQPAPQDGGGVDPGGNNPPQGQSQGS